MDYKSDSYASSDKSDIEEQFIIYPKTKIWLYRLSTTYWEQLKALYVKKKFYISSCIKPPVYRNDIVIIYQKHDTPIKSGFVGICQVKSNMRNNEKNIKIFNDNNMNKYFCDIGTVCLFDEICKISQVENILKLEKNDNTFKKIYVTKMLNRQPNIVQFDNKIGENIVNVLTEGSTFKQNKKEQKYSSDEYESKSDCNSSKFSSESEKTITDSENDDLLVVQGHIPIMMIPCSNLKWAKNCELTINDVKKHFKYCDKCDKIDNNNISIVPAFEKSELFCRELTNNTEINEYLDYYFNLKKYSFELDGQDKKYDHILIFRINQRGNMYHKCILVVW